MSSNLGGHLHHPGEGSGFSMQVPRHSVHSHKPVPSTWCQNSSLEAGLTSWTGLYLCPLQHLARYPEHSGCSISGWGIKSASLRPCWVLTRPCDYAFWKHTPFIICKIKFPNWMHAQIAVCWLFCYLIPCYFKLNGTATVPWAFSHPYLENLFSPTAQLEVGVLPLCQ